MVVGACSLFVPTKEKVTFTVPVQTELFSQEAILHVQIWNAKQMEIMEKQSGCIVSYEPSTKAEQIHCPEGVEYQDLSPEEFELPIYDLVDYIKVTSDVIYTGQEYEIHVYGISADNCNSTSTSFNGKAISNEVTAKHILWRTTEMACSTMP